MERALEDAASDIHIYHNEEMAQVLDEATSLARENEQISGIRE